MARLETGMPTRGELEGRLSLSACGRRPLDTKDLTSPRIDEVPNQDCPRKDPNQVTASMSFGPERSRSVYVRFPSGGSASATR